MIFDLKKNPLGDLNTEQATRNYPDTTTILYI